MKKSRKTAKMMLKLGRSVTSEQQVMKTSPTDKQMLCWLPAIFSTLKSNLLYRQCWTLYKSADCRWMFITILCVSFKYSKTVGSLEQVQLCNPRIDQSADNITGLKCIKEYLIQKYISISRIPDINLNYTCYIKARLRPTKCTKWQLVVL